MLRVVTSFDSLVLAAIARDLEALIGGRITRVVQPTPDEIALDIRHGRHGVTVLASIHPRWARVHVATTVEAGSPSGFCQLLRARVEGAQLVEVLQPAFDRTLTLHLNAIRGRLALAVEIMGRHSNIILVHEGLIVGSLKLVPRTKSSVREVLPGRPYAPPPRDRPTPDELTLETLGELLASSPDPLTKRLSTAILGLSPALATELAVLGGLDPRAPANAQSAAGQRLWPHLQTLRRRLHAKDFAPVLYYNGTTPVGYAPFPFVHLVALREVPVRSMSDAVELVVGRGSAQAQIEEERTRLMHAVEAALTRVQKSARDIREALAEASQAHTLKETGALLLAYASQVPPRVPEVTLSGYDGTPVRIPLDPTLSAVENAQRLFKRYSKLRTAHAPLARRLQEAETEGTYLDAVRVHVGQATTSDDLFDLRQELTEQSYLRARRTATRPSSSGHPRTFQLSGGGTLLVGRSNLENDYLTFKVAGPEDLWFHARGVPGAHVILRLNGNQVGDRDVQDAAAVAAYFSQARGSGAVPVDYTQRRYVRKPRGAKPGMVVYEREHTIHATPGLPAEVTAVDQNA